VSCLTKPENKIGGMDNDNKQESQKESSPANTGYITGADHVAANQIPDDGACGG
jgi:hypothetical protein